MQFIQLLYVTYVGTLISSQFKNFTKFMVPNTFDILVAITTLLLQSTLVFVLKSLYSMLKVIQLFLCYNSRRNTQRKKCIIKNHI